MNPETLKWRAEVLKKVLDAVYISPLTKNEIIVVLRLALAEVEARPVLKVEEISDPDLEDKLLDDRDSGNLL